MIPLPPDLPGNNVLSSVTLQFDTLCAVRMDLKVFLSKYTWRYLFTWFSGHFEHIQGVQDGHPRAFCTCAGTM